MIRVLVAHPVTGFTRKAQNTYLRLTRKNSVFKMSESTAIDILN